MTENHPPPPRQTATDVGAEQAPPEPKAFSAFLIEHNRGRTEAELTARLAELVAAVGSSNKKGSLTLKIEVKPSKTEGVVEVVDDVKLTAPTARARTSMFFIDPATSSLVRNDPNQRAFPGL